jgi:hypothetical protein
MFTINDSREREVMETQTHRQEAGSQLVMTEEKKHYFGISDFVDFLET